MRGEKNRAQLDRGRVAATLSPYAFVIVTLTASLVFAEQQTQQPPARHEVRQHFTVTTPSGFDDFGLTRIQNLTEADDKTVVLIRTATGQNFIATSCVDGKGRGRPTDASSGRFT